MGENTVVPSDGNYVSEETIINEVFIMKFYICH